MTNKAIYRTAIINKSGCIIYMSDLLFATRELAIKHTNIYPCKKEVEILTHKWIDVCITVNNIDTWRTFEKVRNDSDERYIGIITETLALDD